MYFIWLWFGIMHIRMFAEECAAATNELICCHITYVCLVFI